MKTIKQPKERIAYSNYYGEIYTYEDVKKQLIEQRKEFDTVFVYPTEEDVYDFMSELENEDLRTFEDELNEFLSDKTMIMTGTIGRWNGSYSGGKIINCYDDILSFFEDCGYAKIYDCNGHLYCKASHHDGTNYAELKVLTDRGLEYYNNHEYDYEESRLYENLMKYYSKLPNFANLVWGCKKREYEIIS